MAKHVRIEPDCPKCGREMTITNKGLPPFDSKHPWGSGFEAWYSCGFCKFETEHAKAGHRSDACDKAKELAKQYIPND